MQVQREELLESLKIVKDGLSIKAMIEQTDHYCIRDGCVSTFNDRVAVSHPIELSGVEGAVEAKSFLQIITRFKTKTVDIGVIDRQLVVKSGKTKEATLAFCENWEPLPDEFLEGLGRCKHCAGKDKTRPILMCVHASNGFVYSSDGRKLTRYDLGAEAAEQDINITIPSDTIKAVINNEPIEYKTDDIWVHFRNANDTILSVRSMQGEYPIEKCDKLIDTFDGDEIDFPVDLGLVLERAEVFAEDVVTNRTAVIVELTEGLTVISSRNAVGEYREECKNEYEGRDLLFSFPPGMLLDMADDISKVMVNNSAIMFETESYYHVIALMLG
jgi:DNA polymerase III sliding clamp (beta) subunit (PCNA family)